LAAHKVTISPGVLQKAWSIRYLGGVYYFVLSTLLMEINHFSAS